MKRILLVDDDHGYRALLAQALTLRDFDVVQAGDGRDGVRKFRESEFDVVVSDFQMPKLNGIMMLLEILKMEPQQKVVLTSGDWGLRPLMTRAGLPEEIPLLHKPFDLIDILEKLA